MGTKKNMLMTVLCHKCKKTFSLDVSFKEYDLECPRCEKNKFDDFNLIDGVLEAGQKDAPVVKKAVKKTVKKVKKTVKKS